MAGYFDNNRICIDIEVWGISSKFKKAFKAKIDTGFDGYLSMPFSEAMPLGLILKGTQSYVLANGSSSFDLVCLGTVSCNNKKGIIPIDIGSGTSILIGSSLLKELKIGFSVDYINQKISFKNCRVRHTSQVTQPVVAPNQTSQTQS